jgi:tripartite-type tricarboxylate transporter receptor subunit TctC
MMNRGSATRVALLMLWALCSSSAAAQEYPKKAIHLVVPSTPGGGNDLVARLFAGFVQPRLGQTIVVDNKPGAQGLIGTKFVALARSDGYTLLISASISSFPVFNKDPGFSVSRDLEFVSLVMRAPQVFAVNATRDYKSFADLAAISKADPGKLNFTSYGQLLWLQTEIINRAAGIKAIHVPFSNAPEAAKAVSAGDADFMLASMATLQPFIRNGQLRPLAVTSNERDPNIQDVPSIKEAGVQMEDLTVWIGLFTPKGVARPVIDRLNGEARAFVADPDISGKLRAVGFTPFANSPAEFRASFMREEARMVDVGKSLGIQPQ